MTEKTRQFTLDPVDYWRLRAMTSETARAQLEAQMIITKAMARQDALTAALAAKYDGFPSNPGQFQLDDLTLRVDILE